MIWHNAAVRAVAAGCWLLAAALREHPQYISEAEYIYLSIRSRPANYLRFYEVLILCRTFNSPTLGAAKFIHPGTTLGMDLAPKPFCFVG